MTDHAPSNPTPPPSGPTGGTALPAPDRKYLNGDRWFEAHDVLGELRERFQGAVRTAALGRIVGARLAVVGVRGPSTPATDVMPVTLLLGTEARAALGPDVQSHVLSGGGTVEVRLSRLDAVPRPSRVTVLAEAADGRLVTGSATLTGSPDSRLHVSLPWPDEAPPQELAFVIAPEPLALA
jgi:hypothetical protein